jgi:hypothetical protein
MKRRGWLAGVALAMAGCVHGYGGCLFVSPIKHTLTGRVHFRTYPLPSGGVETAPLLTLDRIAYIYSPAQSFMCIPADELQLEGISEFPERVVENSHVSVQGQIVAATSGSDHTRFLMQVITLLPDNSGR